MIARGPLGGILIKRNADAKGLCEAKIFVDSLNARALPFSSLLSTPSSLFSAPRLLPPATLLCNLIHLVMARDQYPFSLA